METTSRSFVVTSLRNFPYRNYDALKSAVYGGDARIGIVPNFVFKWLKAAHSLAYESSWLKTQWMFWGALPVLAAIAVVAYAIISETWFLLAAPIALALAFRLFHPAAALLFGKFRRLLIFSLFLWLPYALLIQSHWLAVMVGAMITIWFAQKTMHNMGMQILVRDVLRREELLCIMWEDQALGIVITKPIGIMRSLTYWSLVMEINGYFTPYPEKAP